MIINEMINETISNETIDEMIINEMSNEWSLMKWIMNDH